MSFHASRDQIERWLEELGSLPFDRRQAVIRMLGEVVAVCPACHEPITRTSSRRLVDDGDEPQFAHLACANDLRPDQPNKRRTPPCKT